MSVRPTRIIRNSLTSKGFVEDNTHHCYFWLYVKGKKSEIYTYFSHGAKECDNFLLSQMAGQLKLSRRQFDDLIDCPMDGKAYIKILVDNGHLPAE